MKKLYVTDLDGTLLNQNASISPYSEQVIKKIIKQGIHFTIATGRSPIQHIFYCTKYSIKYCQLF